jgi:lysophospholipase L1-like esterase
MRLFFLLAKRGFMNKHRRIQRYTFSLALLLIVVISSACATGATIAPTPQPKVTPVPTQPITAQQLLSGPVIYVALGASDAVGIGSAQPGSQGYVPLVADRLPKGSHVINLGISGIHLHQALSEELPLVFSTSPNLITIWLVANDFVAGVPYSSYMQDLDSLLKQLRAGTHARIIMANLPDLTRLPAFSNLSSSQKSKMLAEILRWNAGIAQAAARYVVAIVNLFSQQSQLTAHPEYVSIDGFHPSPSGYVQIANEFWQAITG